jgi:hypothetical protein
MVAPRGPTTGILRGGVGKALLYKITQILNARDYNIYSGISTEMSPLYVELHVFLPFCR